VLTPVQLANLLTHFLVFSSGSLVAVNLPQHARRCTSLLNQQH
jgi:hypothetical protein